MTFKEFEKAELNEEKIGLKNNDNSYKNEK
jgi:hypothetical protein